jgi:transposase InsO family protein
MMKLFIGATTPDIFNTDQGSQIMSLEFTGVLAANGIRISMDGAAGWTTYLSNVYGKR